MNNACHREAVEAIEILPKQVKDIGELCNTLVSKEKAANRAMFKRILQNLCFLARQGLTFRGHGSGIDSNFTQLLQLRSYGCPEILKWMAKKTNKYTSADMQNECRLSGTDGFVPCKTNLQKCSYKWLLYDYG